MNEPNRPCYPTLKGSRPAAHSNSLTRARISVLGIERGNLVQYLLRAAQCLGFRRVRVTNRQVEVAESSASADIPINSRFRQSWHKSPVDGRGAIGRG